MLVRALYRARQFFGALNVVIEPEELEEALRPLAPAQRQFFLSMDRRDQRHGLDVWRMLRERAPADADLLTAALLHDCGKGPQTVWTRVAHVALQNLAPRLEARMVRRGGALDRLRRHPELGAERAIEAGCSAETVRLIREQEREGALDARLTLLREADEAN